MSPLHSFGLIFGVALVVDLVIYAVAGLALWSVYRKGRRRR